MRSIVSLGLLSFYASLIATLGVLEDSCGSGDENPSRLRVGAAVVTILPEVGGSTAYFDPIRSLPPLALEPGDPGQDPGVFVEEWDVGTIAIGNGRGSSHWVHDEIRAGAVAFKDLDHPEGRTLVMVSADVYMLLRQDLEEVYDKVRLRIGDTSFQKLDILVSATHNHMGPDTSGIDGINHDYYNYLTTQIASAIVDAVSEQNMQPAVLRVASSSYQFGLADSHAPYIADPTLNSMQAVHADDHSRVIATLFQWQNHPEDTLGFGRNVFATDEQAEYLKSIEECYSDDGVHCHVEGQFISAGFAGIAARHLMDLTGAPALYFNGPVGGLAAPLHAYVWETEGPDGKPAGDGLEIPEGAVLLEKSFHKQAVNGAELGRRVMSDLVSAETVFDPSISAYKKEFYSRLSNLGFRIGMVVRPTGQPLQLGHLKRDLFTCPDQGPKDDTTCVSDKFESSPDPILKIPVRVGTHGKSEAWYVRIGPVGMVTIPGEAVVEVVEGLPSDFYSDPRGNYYLDDEDRANHAVGTKYTTSGYVRQAMTDRYKWALGLTQDELGYMIPLSDWRIFCVADEEDLGGAPGTCKALKEAGIIDYEDYDRNSWAISGARCKEIFENPGVLELPPYTDVPGGGDSAWNSCYYGQLWNDADAHYEETLSPSWDFADDWTQTVKALTGWEGELEQVNPDFVSRNLLAP